MKASALCISIYLSIYCYAAMCPVGLQGAVRSRQVHQLKQGTNVGCGLPTLFNITDITTTTPAEPHFKATRWVLGELLIFNTANWLAFPLKRKAFDKYNTSTTKNGLWTAVSGSTRLITILFYWIKERNKKKTIQVKTRSEKVFLLNSGRWKYSLPAVDREMYVLFQVRPRLIIVSFFVDKSFLWVFI